MLYIYLKLIESRIDFYNSLVEFKLRSGFEPESLQVPDLCFLYFVALRQLYFIYKNIKIFMLNINARV